MLLAIVVLAVTQAAGCEKDTDCKGDRVCEAGQCVSPPVRAIPVDPASLTPPPLPPVEDPGAAPRVPAPVGPCDQPIGMDGRLKPECRVNPSAPVRRTRPDREAPSEDREPATRAVGLIAVSYGILAAGGALVPTFAFTGSAGVRFRSGVGVVGVVHGTIFASSLGSIQFYGVGPGLRLGNRSHITLGMSPTVGAVSTGGTLIVGLVLSVYAQLVLVLGDHFSLLAAPTIHFDASGVLGVITGGLGVTF